jgi:putative membrane protein
MTAKNQSPNSLLQNIFPWLDIFALLTWGILFLKYSLTGQLKLLIHPNYFWLVIVTGVIFLLLSLIKLGQTLKEMSGGKSKVSIQHISLFAPGIGSSLLIIVAVLGLFINPGILTSKSAIQRGITESLPITRSQPESFRTATKPEERSLIDWIRTLNAYPEPDEYAGQKAKISGFVVHLPQLPDNYFMICRFIITCCAVDAYPVGIPVKIESPRSAYPPDTWLEIEGEMLTETLTVDRATMTQVSSGKRQLVLIAKTITPIPTPDDPYGY